MKQIEYLNYYLYSAHNLNNNNNLPTSAERNVEIFSTSTGYSRTDKFRLFDKQLLLRVFGRSL